MSLGSKNASLPLSILLHACRKLSIVETLSEESSCRRGCTNVAHGRLGSFSLSLSLFVQDAGSISCTSLTFVCARQMGNFQQSPAGAVQLLCRRSGLWPTAWRLCCTGPRLEVATRRMRWLVTLANQMGFAGTVHRPVICPHFRDRLGWNHRWRCLQHGRDYTGWWW